MPSRRRHRRTGATLFSDEGQSPLTPLQAAPSAVNSPVLIKPPQTSISDPVQTRACPRVPRSRDSIGRNGLLVGWARTALLAICVHDCPPELVMEVVEAISADPSVLVGGGVPLVQIAGLTWFGERRPAEFAMVVGPAVAVPRVGPSNQDCRSKVCFLALPPPIIVICRHVDSLHRCLAALSPRLQDCRRPPFPLAGFLLCVNPPVSRHRREGPRSQSSSSRRHGLILAWSV